MAGTRTNSSARAAHHTDSGQQRVVPGIDARVLELIGDAPASAHTVRASDGTELSYKVFGDAGPVVAFCNGLGGTYRTFADVFAQLLGQYRIVVYDYRGLFESGPPMSPNLDVATHAEDLMTVLDAAQAPGAVLFGWSMGVQVALEAYRRAPDRVHAMILASGVPGRLLDSVAVVPGSAPIALAGTRVMSATGSRIANLLGHAVRTRPVKRVARAMGLVGRNVDITMEHAALLLSSDPAVYWRIVEQLHRHDASDVLTTIDVPVLILHGDADVLTPVRLGREMRVRIPGSEMHVFGGCTHAVVLEFPERVVRHVVDFLTRRLPHSD